MGILENQLNRIKQKFPQQSERIEELYQSSDDFRTLCSDYLLCSRELKRFHHEASDKEQSVKEYKNMQEELESELFHFIFPM